MHPVAKRCLWWAAALVIVGALFILYGPTIIYRASEYLGRNGRLGFYPIALIAQMITSFAMPLGAALVGAAVVIQTLAPKPGGTNHAATGLVPPPPAEPSTSEA
jgi:hypothetical protein